MKEGQTGTRRNSTGISDREEQSDDEPTLSASKVLVRLKNYLSFQPDLLPIRLGSLPIGKTGYALPILDEDK